MSMATPPPYSSQRRLSVDVGRPAAPSPDPPVYSTQPHEDEETVASTPRVGSITPQGTFIRQWGQATLILKDQENGARLPTYSRNGRITGEIELKNTDKIIRVTAKLQGHMSLSSADTGSMAASLVSESQVLWKQQPADGTTTDTANDQRCPSILPLYIQFPHFYEVEGKNWRLPPSFEATFLGIPALFVRCMYTLSITITRTRSYHLASWTTNKTYMTMVNFRPRTRPSRPIILSDSVFSSIKPDPEEWLQVVATMGVRPKANIKPIECHLFIPSVQTFALTDTIPFHLQLCSSLASFRELLPQSSPHLRITSPTLSKIVGDPFAPDCTIRVSIARQVVIEINGKRRFRTFTIGMGKMWSIPPQATAVSFGDHRGSDSTSEDPDADISLDWQGELKCWGEVTSGGFSVSNLIVKRGTGHRFRFPENMAPLNEELGEALDIERKMDVS
ncbi:hypothetical protein JR316_0001935 [Psilocybe cubensis]|uniref:Uncharacterized protein n=2 Tax=Psilocybe cubensis TaxID=181762 RepID=A0ACB8HAS5_PSICU|nr:hypothetical protein JR316_0001935 [Psilocybe cubensis]KAH9485031.1 hypothetical protein JR316_0001935 [Psilocybe cubensis]